MLLQSCLPSTAFRLFSILRKLILALHPSFTSSSSRYTLLDAIDIVSNPFYVTGQHYTPSTRKSAGVSASTSSPSPPPQTPEAAARRQVASALVVVDDAIHVEKLQIIVADLEATASVIYIHTCIVLIELLVSIFFKKKN